MDFAVNLNEDSILIHSNSLCKILIYTALPITKPIYVITADDDNGVYGGNKDSPSLSVPG